MCTKGPFFSWWFAKGECALIKKEVNQVYFNRREITLIMGLYGRMVARGLWRDYAIDGLTNRAVFSIFRHASEMPLYRVEKVPDMARRQGQYSVIAMGGRIMKRGSDLAQVLKAFDSRRFSVVRGR